MKDNTTDFPDDLFKVKWQEEQECLKAQLIECDDPEFESDLNYEQSKFVGPNQESIPASDQWRSIHLVGGVDVSFVKGSDENACATLVILSFPELEVIHEMHHQLNMPLPYIAGFLAFREVPILQELIQELREKKPELEPDVVFVDGNGILHPKGFGLASHLGVLTGLRTIGIAKTFLHVDGLTKDGVKSALESQKQVHGDETLFLRGESGKVWGAAICPGKNVTNPIFVSVGHKISLQTALALTKACSIYRIPEPVRQADIRSRIQIRENQTQHH